MEHILYVILVFTGNAGAEVDSQRFDSKAACEAAAKEVRATLRQQGEDLEGNFNRFNVQLRCVPAGDE